MEAGDQNVAFISLCCTNVHGFMAGVPLAALKADADLVLGLLHQYQQDQVLCIFGPWREMIMDLSSSKSAGELEWRDEAFVEARKKSVHLRTSCVESSVLDIGTLSGRSTTSRDPTSYVRPGVALSSSTSSARSGALSLLCPTRIRHRSRASRFVSICSRPAKIWSAISLAGRPSRRRSTRHRHIKRRLTASSLRARARRSPDRRCSLRRLRRKSMKSDV